jgi:hypothetical protein
MTKQGLMRSVLILTAFFSLSTSHAREIYRCDDLASRDTLYVTAQAHGRLMGIYKQSISDSHSQYYWQMSCEKRSSRNSNGLKFVCEGENEASKWTANLYEDRAEFLLNGAAEPRVLKCNL